MTQNNEETAPGLNQNWNLKDLILLGASSLLLLIGVGVFLSWRVVFNPLDDWKLYSYALTRFGLPGILLIFIFLKIFPVKFNENIKKLAYVNLAAAIMSASVGGALYYNGNDGGSEQVTHKQMIVQSWKNYRWGAFPNSGRGYFVRVYSWRPGKDFEEFEIIKSDYLKVQPNKSFLLVTTKQGKLGFEWLVSSELSEQ